VKIFLFFFSSRRRHTRFSRDWSSDVCSSDLKDLVDPIFKFFRQYGFPKPDKISKLTSDYKKLVDKKFDLTSDEIFNNSSLATYRSEERRVGKCVDLVSRGMCK